jgi:hypothetical protein
MPDLKQKITNDFGLHKMDSESQEKMIERIGNMLFEAVIERSIDEMDEPSLKEFESLIGTVGEDYRQVITFLTKHVSGFQSIVSEELSRLKRTSSGIFA